MVTTPEQKQTQHNHVITHRDTRGDAAHSLSYVVINGGTDTPNAGRSATARNNGARARAGRGAGGDGTHRHAQTLNAHTCAPNRVFTETRAHTRTPPRAPTRV
ncbi:hypothetical protein EVAR_14343_1 [Eumeta japonica]|uniref:Uncharacterized protein n=1 Tax=Eumeta variegata TaxID=151549 RepID=A0A4C1TXG4_EUMVA|nr:hypothetical protein EVAR_14343_1 [Eumeta japonica]